jgi:two-component system CheB/CheR fusion protein
MVEALKPTPPSPADQSITVVGIGGSAEALIAFAGSLTAIPAGSRLSFILVAPLAAQDGRSLAHELITACPIPVVEAHDGVAIRPGHVYVLPPGMHLAFFEGALHQVPMDAPQVIHHPIDHLLRSLAGECSGCALGVVLSGSGSDGTLGLADIRSSGGITFVQDPLTAAHPEMPASAIAYGCADFVLVPADVVQGLVQASRQPYVLERHANRCTDLQAEEVEGFGHILTILSDISNVDFSLYRASTIKRRIQRRMAMCGASSLASYAASLAANAREVAALVKDVLIHVTRFFRDEAVFQSLRTVVFPGLSKRHAAHVPIRIWMVACSTGQETYSVAIELMEFLDGLHGHGAHPKVQIFATDISEASLATARTGWYPAAIASEISPERLGRHFTKAGDGYRISSSIREMCVFARHDVTSDTPFSKIDLICCRDVLVHLALEQQARVISTFHYTLMDGGCLLLGNCESAGRSPLLFQAIDAKNRVYAKRPSVRRSHAPGSLPLPTSPLAASRPQGPSLPDVQHAADRIMLGRYAPASILVDQRYQVLQFRGNLAAFLNYPQGEATLDVRRMAHVDLAQDLIGAIEDARSSTGTSRRRGIRLTEGSSSRLIDLEVSQIQLPQAEEPTLLIIFEQALAVAATPGLAAAIEAHPLPMASGSAASIFSHLEQERNASRDHLQALTNENNSVNEELRFANDEASSSNEELRCTNEELQLAKEQFQTANEELITLNEELRHSGDLAKAIVETVRDPLLVLDSDLRVQTVSRAFVRVFDHADENPVGRLVYQLGGGDWDIPELRRLLEGILHGSPAMDDFEVTHDFARIGRRTMLLNARLLAGPVGSARMIVLAIADITEQKRLSDEVKLTQENARQSGDLAKAIVETVRDPLLVLDSDLRVQTVSRAFVRVFDHADENPAGKLVYHLGGGDWDIPELRRILEGILHGSPAMDDFEVTHDFARIGRRTMLLNARLLEGPVDSARMIVLAIEDITEQKRLSDEVKQTQEIARQSGDLAKAIVETVRDPLLVLDSDLRVRTVSRAFIRVFDHMDEDPIGRLIYQLGDSEWDIAELRRLLEGILHGSPAMDDFEVTHDFARIGRRTMLLNARLLEGPVGGVRMIVLAIADVTAQKRLSDDLNFASLELRRSNEDLDQFAAIASHDLQEPLRMITNYTHLLKQRLGGTLDAKCLEFMAFVIDGATRMRGLILAILDYSHVGQQGIKSECINMQEIVRTTLVNLERKIHDAKAEIVCEAMPSVVADPVLIAQLLQNLVSNAIKFTAKDRTPRVVISSREAEREWTFSVADNGIGISAHDTGRIFVLFQRLHPTSAYPGTGIGLATCKKIVERHHGRLYLESTIDVGTTFFFTLPKP